MRRYRTVIEMGARQSPIPAKERAASPINRELKGHPGEDMAARGRHTNGGSEQETCWKDSQVPASRSRALRMKGTACSAWYMDLK